MNYAQKAREIHEARMALWIEAGRPRVLYMGKPRRVCVFGDGPLMFKPWDDLYLEEILEELRMRNLGIIQ